MRRGEEQEIELISLSICLKKNKKIEKSIQIKQNSFHLKKHIIIKIMCKGKTWKK